jgi:hypothetical protein
MERELVVNDFYFYFYFNEVVKVQRLENPNQKLFQQFILRPLESHVFIIS